MKQNSENHIAYDLLTKYLLGEANAEECALVERWLEVSEENQKEFWHLKRIWLKSEPFDNKKTQFDVDKAWNKLHARIHSEKKDAKTYKLTPSLESKDRVLWKNWWKIASVLVLAVGLGLIYKFTSNQNPTAPTLVAISTQENILQDTLPDGSIIRLNQYSELSYLSNFAKNDRKVVLSGEAYFDVAHDGSKPFVIDAGDAEVRVLGTSFNVRAIPEEEEVSVVVENGKVRLSSQIKKDQKTELIAGEKGILNQKKQKVEKTLELDPKELFWHNRTLVFNRTELFQVIQTLNDLFDTEISTENKNILDCRLTATFKNEPIGEILNVIAATFELEVMVENEKITLSGRGCD
ncbi:FecR family protein [Xanthovirga aplysinae]|uniref:FecR family protein n=1 Tax=Xanthovirga aplysinae TaxID=2529853 RepID=UPI0012BB5F08|nr:FecR domain-containing protein [Xanthovirga aplysinae]MTI32557.1 DUF4974 domain-containing protein [Xanthovirga aplysinae]